MKKKNIVGYGAGGHAGILIDIIEDSKKYKIIGLIDKSLKNKKKHGIPILGNDKILKKIYKKGIKKIFLGIADIHNIEKNTKIFNKLCAIGFDIVNTIHKSSIISKKAKFGKGVKIFAGVKVNANAKIGKNVLLNTGCIVEHDCVIGDHAQIGPGAFLGGNVIVGRGSFIGLGARINQGIKIGKGSFIGSGSVVIKNIGKNKKVAGIPAREIKKSND